VEAHSPAEWEQFRRTLRGRVTPVTWQTWLASLEPYAIEGGVVSLRAPSEFHLRWVNDKFRPIMEEAVTSVFGPEARLVLDARSAPLAPEAEDLEEENEPEPEEEPPPPGRGLPLAPPPADGLVPKYSFENFVVGPSNRFAHAAALAIAEQPGGQYNPLFIYAGAGLGKTHLLQAIARHVMELHPRLAVRYTTSEAFFNDFIDGIRRKRMDEFKARYRGVDVLLLDDVQFLEGKEQLLEEFFHTFNALHEHGKQLVFSCDRPPRSLVTLEDRLRSRFDWGLTTDIQPPDVETRVAIVQKKAEAEHIDLPHDVAMFLATNIDSNVRELEGSLTRLGAFASLNKCDITVDFARQVLQHIIRERPGAVTIEIIQKAVCDFYRLRPADLRSKKRSRAIAVPRQVAMFLCRRHTDASFPTIGDRFGGRDHSTAIHAIQVVEQRIKEDPTFRATVERIERMLENAE